MSEPERKKVRQTVHAKGGWYDLEDVQSGITLGELNAAVASLIVDNGADMIVQISAPSCGTCENDDIDVEFDLYREREETDAEFTARTNREQRYREQNETRDRQLLQDLLRRYPDELAKVTDTGGGS